MKKLILPIIIGAALTLTGCATKPDVKALNQPLTTAISQHQYAKAAGLNAAIIELDDSAKAQQRAKQLTALTKAQSALAANDFKEAQRQAKLATKGDAKLALDAKKLVAKAAKLRTTEADLTSQLAAITSLAASDAAGANTKLQALLAKDSIQQDRFQALYIQALKLQTKLATQTRSSDPETAPTTPETEASDTATASSSSATGEAASSSTASTRPEGQPIAGADTITAADLDSARADIKAAGENPNFFSGNDLSRAILKARADGRTHLQASDWQ